MVVTAHRIVTARMKSRNIGFCKECGWEHSSVLPTAVNDYCNWCRTNQVDGSDVWMQRIIPELAASRTIEIPYAKLKAAKKESDRAVIAIGFCTSCGEQQDVEDRYEIDCKCCYCGEYGVAGLDKLLRFNRTARVKAAREARYHRVIKYLSEGGALASWLFPAVGLFAGFYFGGANWAMPAMLLSLLPLLLFGYIMVE